MGSIPPIGKGIGDKLNQVMGATAQHAKQVAKQQFLNGLEALGGGGKTLSDSISAVLTKPDALAAKLKSDEIDEIIKNSKLDDDQKLAAEKLLGAFRSLVGISREEQKTKEVKAKVAVRKNLTVTELDEEDDTPPPPADFTEKLAFFRAVVKSTHDFKEAAKFHAHSQLGITGSELDDLIKNNNKDEVKRYLERREEDFYKELSSLRNSDQVKNSKQEQEKLELLGKSFEALRVSVGLAPKAVAEPKPKVAAAPEVAFGFNALKQKVKGAASTVSDTVKNVKNKLK